MISHALPAPKFFQKSLLQKLQIIGLQKFLNDVMMKPVDHVNSTKIWIR